MSQYSRSEGFDPPCVMYSVVSGRSSVFPNGADQAIDWVAEMRNATRQAFDVNEAKNVNATANTTELVALDMSAFADVAEVAFAA